VLGPGIVVLDSQHLAHLVHQFQFRIWNDQLLSH
jgi:hypothetical protein